MIRPSLLREGFEESSGGTGESDVPLDAALSPLFFPRGWARPRRKRPRTARSHHGDHGPRWVVPGRAPSPKRLQSLGNGPPLEHRWKGAAGALARSYSARFGGHHGSLIPPQAPWGDSAGRSLQSRRPVLRSDFMAGAAADGANDGPWRAELPGGHSVGQPENTVLPSFLERNVWQGPGDPADGSNSLSPPFSLRRLEALRPLGHGQLPGVLWHLRLLRHPLQSRVSPQGTGVCQSKGDVSCRPDCPGP